MMDLNNNNNDDTTMMDAVMMTMLDENDENDLLMIDIDIDGLDSTDYNTNNNDDNTTTNNTNNTTNTTTTNTTNNNTTNSNFNNNNNNNNDGATDFDIVEQPFSASESDEKYPLQQQLPQLAQLPQLPHQLPHQQLQLQQQLHQQQQHALGALGFDFDFGDNTIDFDDNTIKHIESINDITLLDDVEGSNNDDNDDGTKDNDTTTTNNNNNNNNINININNQRYTTHPTPPRSSASRSRSPSPSPSPRYSTSTSSASSSSSSASSSSSSSDDAKYDKAIYAMFPRDVLQLLRPDFNQWRKDNDIAKFTNRAMQKRLTVIRRKIHSRLYAKTSRVKHTHKVMQETTEFEQMKQRIVELEKSDEAAQQHILMLEQRLLALGQPL